MIIIYFFLWIHQFIEKKKKNVWKEIGKEYSLF